MKCGGCFAITGRGRLCCFSYVRCIHLVVSLSRGNVDTEMHDVVSELKPAWWSCHPNSYSSRQNPETRSDAIGHASVTGDSQSVAPPSLSQTSVSASLLLLTSTKCQFGQSQHPGSLRLPVHQRSMTVTASSAGRHRGRCAARCVNTDSTAYVDHRLHLYHSLILSQTFQSAFCQK